MAEFLNAKRRDPHRGYRFRLTDLSGEFQFGGFRLVSGLGKEIEVVEYREGDDGATVRKLPGMANFPNVVLEKGISDNNSLQIWSDKAYQALADDTLAADDELRKDIRVVLLARGGTVAKGWRVLECWPAIHGIADMDASSSDVLIERVELANEGNYLEGTDTDPTSPA